jgi:hypothetical protein
MTNFTYFPPVIRHWSVPTLWWCTVSASSRVWTASPIQVSFTRTEAWRIYYGMYRHLSLNLHHPEFKSPRKLLSRSLTWERQFNQLCTTDGHNDRSRWLRGLRRGSWLLGLLRARIFVSCVCCVLCVVLCCVVLCCVVLCCVVFCVVLCCVR